MAFTARITVYPDVPGGFTPTSFADLVQHEVHLPGLDTSWTHTLIGVSVALDGSSADLTVSSEPIAALSLDQHLRITGAPAARVRVVDGAGMVLAENSFSAPLQDGQEVEVAGEMYTVTSSSWPGRDPVTGICEGDLDWQVAVVVATPRPAAVPVAAPVPAAPASTAGG